MRKPETINPLMPYTKTTLPCGFTLLHKEVRAAPIIGIDIWVKTGAVNDPDPHYGLSHFFEHMFFKGTERHGVGVMDRIITSLGGYNNAATSLDYTHYYVVLPSAGWKKALDVLIDSLMNPLFDPEEIERERAVINEEIKRHEDNPWSKIYDKFTRAAFSRCRYQRDVLGTHESLETIQRDTFVDYHQKRYHPENITLCLIGDLSYQEAEDELNHLLDHTPLPSAPFEEEALDWPLIEEPASVTMKRDVNQSYLILGYALPDLFETPHEYALDLLSMVFGEGKSSRLHRRLNDELGIVSSISCSYWNLANAGLFLIEAVTEPEKVQQVEDEITGELQKLRSQILPGELTKVKSMSRADFAFSNEKVISIAHTFGFGHTMTTIENAVHYQERIETVTLDQLEHSFDTFLTPNRLCKGLLLPNT